MKNLVFGALISALSFSAFAADYVAPTPAHSLHHDLELMVVTIESLGTDVKWDDCSPSEISAPLFVDGNSVTGTMSAQSFKFHSLHYGQSFVVCKKAVLGGGFMDLKMGNLKFDGFLDVISDSGYLTASGLKLVTTINCYKNGASFGTIFPALPTVQTDVVDGVEFSTYSKATIPNQGLAAYCIVKGTFTETTVGERSLTSNNVILNWNLDVGINAE